MFFILYLCGKTYTMIEKIEEKICEYFGVDKELLVATSSYRQPSFARSYLWYILHYDCGLSVNKIAKQYGRTPRRINRVVSKIKYLIETQKAYKEHYNALCL